MHARTHARTHRHGCACRGTHRAPLGWPFDTVGAVSLYRIVPQGIGPLINQVQNKEWTLLVDFINQAGNDSGVGNNVDWAVEVLRKATNLQL